MPRRPTPGSASSCGFGLLLETRADLAPDRRRAVPARRQPAARPRRSPAAAERLLGLSETEATGRPIGELLVAPDAEAGRRNGLAALIAEVAGGGEADARPTSVRGTRSACGCGRAISACGPPRAALDRARRLAAAARRPLRPLRPRPAAPPARRSARQALREHDRAVLRWPFSSSAMIVRRRAHRGAVQRVHRRRLAVRPAVADLEPAGLEIGGVGARGELAVARPGPAARPRSRTSWPPRRRGRRRRSPPPGRGSPAPCRISSSMASSRSCSAGRLRRLDEAEHLDLVELVDAEDARGCRGRRRPPRGGSSWRSPA